MSEFKTLKDFYEPISSDLASKDKPYAFIIPLFSQDFFVKEIPKDKFINKILNLNHLTAELGNYNEYATLLNLLDSDFKIWQLREAALHNILEPAHCYEIGMRKSDGVEKNLQRLKDSILK